MFNTFDSFISSTIGRSIGDGECWDYINQLWLHLGSRYYTFPPSDPESTNHGVKWGVLNLEARQANIIPHLSFISDIRQLKRGDIVITTNGTYGHGGFLNENYVEGKIRYSLYTQNFNGRRSVALDTYSLADFGGAFRYDAWESTPPSPPIPVTQKKTKRFPWAIYGNRIREKALI